MAVFTKIRIMPQEEADAEYKRQGSNVEKLDDYIDTLRTMEIGQAFTVSVDEQMAPYKQKDGTIIEKLTEFVPETTDDNGQADTVRMFKRRMNAGADTLNFKLKWKVKGHRVPDPTEKNGNRFVSDWLIARADHSTPTTTSDEEEEIEETVGK